MISNISHDAIRNARIAAGLTIESAAYQVGCSVRTIARAESGESRSRVTLLARLAALYGVPLTTFVHASKGNDAALSRVKTNGKESK